ncbi:MAG: glycosyl hydrolase 53 family protein [Paludibacter sp.]|nr:glycosyl hydrolase 53 family protein [Paludibacter sp.]
MKNRVIIGIIYYLFSLSYITKANSSEKTSFALGADISWITEMESAGKLFYTSDGNPIEIIALTKSLGMNSVRLRVWVDPIDGWCNTADLLIKAKRANELGMRIMIDFHYSDWWADPGKQTKPVSWTNLNLNELKNAIGNHTREVLNVLKSNNINPEWVQVGNETGNGMLWDTGKASASMANYSALNNAGYDAVKEVFPQAKVIVHLQSGHDNGLFRWLFDGLKNNGGKWDVIGMSLYPSWYKTPNDWQNANFDCLSNMNDMVARYNTDVMIVECGMSWDNAQVCKNFLSDIIQKTKSIANNKGLGVLYWEPQSYSNWKGYSLGAFDNTGKPTIALDAFKNATNINSQTSPSLSFSIDSNSTSIQFNKTLKLIELFNVSGVLIKTATNTNSININNLDQALLLIKATDYDLEKKTTLKFIKY